MMPFLSSATFSCLWQEKVALDRNGIFSSLENVAECCQEFHVVACFCHLLQERFCGLQFVFATLLVGKSGEHAPHDDDCAQGFVVEEQFFAAGAGAGNVDGGEDAAFGKFTVQDQFHVAGAFEFLINYFIHAATGIDQGGCDDGQAASLFDV